MSSMSRKTIANGGDTLGSADAHRGQTMADAARRVSLDCNRRALSPRLSSVRHERYTAKASPARPPAASTDSRRRRWPTPGQPGLTRPPDARPTGVDAVARRTTCPERRGVTNEVPATAAPWPADTMASFAGKGSPCASPSFTLPWRALSQRAVNRRPFPIPDEQTRCQHQTNLFPVFPPSHWPTSTAVEPGAEGGWSPAWRFRSYSLRAGAAPRRIPGTITYQPRPWERG